jgi:hypothetical protein
MTRIAFAIVMLSASVASADYHQRSIFRGELRVQVWTPDKKPLPDVTVAFFVGDATDPERKTATGAEEPPSSEMRIAKARDARSPTKSTANADALVARYRSQAPFWRVGPGTYNVRLGLSMTAWSDPVEVKFTAHSMRWNVILTLDPKTRKLVGKPLVQPQ